MSQCHEVQNCTLGHQNFAHSSEKTLLNSDILEGRAQQLSGATGPKAQAINRRRVPLQGASNALCVSRSTFADGLRQWLCQPGLRS